MKLGGAGRSRHRLERRHLPGTVGSIAAQAEFTPNNVETKEQRVKLVYEVRVHIADKSGTLKAGMPVDVTF